MPMTNDLEVARANRAARQAAQDAARAALRDRPDEWMDEMIERFFLETGKQLKSVEETKAYTVDDQAQHARTLASLERTLERLSRMQTARASRERKVAMSDDEARAAFERRLDQRAGSADAKEPAR